jgi:3-oxoacyl-[acyl-carrier protein] reductase
LSSKIAVITGGHGDLAKGIARSLCEASFEVRAPSRTELDVTDASSVSRYFDSLERLDLLVNNAGITGDGLIARQNPGDWSAVIDTSLKGAHLCSQAAALIMMRQRDGHIVNIGSYSADHPPVGQTAYAAAKAGLVGLTKSFAKELGKRNLRVNCVLPGFLETKMTANLSEAAMAEAKKRHQLGRFNTVEEASRFITFLATTEHISGQVFQLDSRA